MTHSQKIATLRTQIAQTEWHTERLELLGFNESYLDSHFLCESLRSQLQDALVRPSRLTKEGD
jgi:hypothetical protein